jgi:hypothetical protein
MTSVRSFGGYNSYQVTRSPLIHPSRWGAREGCHRSSTAIA